MSPMQGNVKNRLKGWSRSRNHQTAERESRTAINRNESMSEWLSSNHENDIQKFKAPTTRVTCKPKLRQNFHGTKNFDLTWKISRLFTSIPDFDTCRLITSKKTSPSEAVQHRLANKIPNRLNHRHRLEIALWKYFLRNNIRQHEFHENSW